MIRAATLLGLIFSISIHLAAPALAAAKSSLRRTPVVRAVEKAGPAVANIYTETVVEPFAGNPFGSTPWRGDLFSQFFRGNPPTQRPRETRRSSLGSGLIIRSDGTLVTNEHVIVQASGIRVLLADKREFAAELIGADSDFDIAVLKLTMGENPQPLPYVQLAEDDDIMIGETVIAIGNPYGLSHTVTTGVVSATGRTLRAGEMVYHDFIQTDASINPGNSGGPLLDVEGRLLGINTAIHREGEGIGFAIPNRRVRSIVNQILDHGGVQPSWIGITTQDLSSELAYHFGVNESAGVLVASTDEDGPAHQAAIQPGDIITHVDGNRVRASIEFDRSLRGVTAGDRVELTLLREGERISSEVKVATVPLERMDTLAWRMVGVAVASPRQGGVVVERVRAGSPANRIGLERGDVIAALGGREVSDLDGFRRAIHSYRHSNNMLLSVVRGRRLYRVTIPLDRLG